MCRRVLIWLGVTVLVAVTATMLLTRSREPTHQGRPLSAYVQEGVIDPATGLPSPAYAVVSKMGTNAIPYLLKWIQYEQPAWKWWLLSLKEKMREILHLSPGNADRFEQRSYNSMQAFSALGPSANAAVPELVRLFTSTNETVRRRAGYALSTIRPAGVVAMLCTVTNQSATELNEIGGAIGTEWPGHIDPVVPLLLEWLKDRDQRVVLAGIKAMPYVPLGAGRSNTWDALLTCLQDSRLPVRTASFYALKADYLLDSRIVPAFLALRDDPHFQEEIAMMQNPMKKEILANIALCACALTNKDFNTRLQASNRIDRYNRIMQAFTNSPP